MLALLAAVLSQVAPVRDSPKDWQLITTEHSNIYYPSEELLPRARQFAGWFEDARVRLVSATGIEPKRVNAFLYWLFLDLVQSSYLGRVEPLSQRVRKPALGDRSRAGAGGAAARPHLQRLRNPVLQGFPWAST